MTGVALLACRVALLYSKQCGGVTELVPANSRPAQTRLAAAEHG